MSIDPEVAYAHYQLGLTLQKQGDSAAAMALHKNTSWALIERPYSCAPQAVGAVYDRPGFFVQSPQRLNISSRRCASIRDTSEKFGDSEQFLAVQKLLTVPEFVSRQFLRVAVLAFRSSRAPQPPRPH